MIKEGTRLVHRISSTEELLERVEYFDSFYKKRDNICIKLTLYTDNEDSLCPHISDIAIEKSEIVLQIKEIVKQHFVNELMNDKKKFLELENLI
jgi:hypothetical protein